MGKGKLEHSKMFKQVLAIVAAFVMIVSLMPVNVAKAEEAGNNYETGLYFANWDWETRKLLELSEGCYTYIPEDAAFSLIYVDKGIWKHVDADQVAVTYCDKVDDGNPAALNFKELNEDQRRKIEFTEDELKEEWPIKKFNGADFGLAEEVPVTYWNLNKAGTYKLTYTVKEKEYSCYIYMKRKGYNFYEGDKVTDEPLSQYYYKDITEDTGFYLLQSDEGFTPGKLTYDDEGNVKINKDGTPVLDSEGPLVAASYVWNEEKQEEEFVADCSNCISYDDKTGRISIIDNPAEGLTDYIVRIYFYGKNEYEEDGKQITEYWQDVADVGVCHGENMENSISLSYDNYDGTVSYKQKDADKEDIVSLEPETVLEGEEGVVYDFYLTEKPAYPDDFDWDNATEDDINRYGWREGAKPIVIVDTADGQYRYCVDNTDSAYNIDDCGDNDNKTWHFTYTFKPWDNMAICWSEYDSFWWDPTTQFQICLPVDEWGTATLSPTVAEGDCYKDSEYGERYNFSIDQIGKVAVTIKPKAGKILYGFTIGDVNYINQCFKEDNDSREVFVTKADGSWTHIFTEEEVKAYDYDGEEKIPRKNELGEQCYECVNIEMQCLPINGFNWNVSSEAEDLAEKGIASVSYKINDATEWTTVSKTDADYYYIVDWLEKNDKVTVKYTMNKGYVISAADFSAKYYSPENEVLPYKPADSAVTTEGMVEALMSEDGFTFNFNPESDQLTLLQLQFSVEKEGHRHSLVKTDAKAATCTTAGNKEYWTCSDSACGKVYSDAEGKTETTVSAITVAPLGHRFDNGTITKAPTATQDGVKTYTCSVCGTKKTEIISASGAPKVGYEFQAEKTQSMYKVTSDDANNPMVSFVGTKDNKTKSVTIPAEVTLDGITYKVTAIADNAFKGNKKITQVKMDKNIKTIGKNAFSGCTKLKTVSVGSNVTAVGAGSFKNCKSLTKITLPGKVTKIGANAFNGCKKLKTITIKSKKMNTKTIAKNAFKGIGKNATVKVPKGKAKAYKTLFQKKGLNKKVKVK